MLTSLRENIALPSNRDLVMFSVGITKQFYDWYEEEEDRSLSEASDVDIQGWVHST